MKNPELLISMLIEHRMTDSETIRIFGALQYSTLIGYGQGFEFGGDFDFRNKDVKQPLMVAAIDAIRGGGPAMTEEAMLRDMNKARLAFHGANKVRNDLQIGGCGC